MKFFSLLTTESSRKKLLISFILSSILPLLIMVAIIFHFVLPVLNPGQVRALGDAFSFGFLVLISLSILGLILLFGVIRSLENLTREIEIKSSLMMDVERAEVRNEMVSLQNIFDRLYVDLQDKMNQLGDMSRSLIKLNLELSREAITDELTSLYNRRYFYDRLSDDVSRLADFNPDLSVMMIDIDDFKHFNDKYGHQTGDKILQTLGRLYRDVVRKTDCCFRYGGDEFAVILPSCDVKQAEALARKLVETVSGHEFVDLDGNRVDRVTISCGIAVYHYGQSVEEFVGELDRWLHTAKVAGKNRVEVSTRLPRVLDRPEALSRSRT